MTPKRASKKHKGIRDPIKQNQARYDKIKNKINNPPKHADTQEIPKRFLQISNESIMLPPRKKRKKDELMDTARFVNRDVGSYPQYGKPFKPVPTVQQEPGEKPHRFMRRVHQATMMVIKESQFQDKFNVEVKRDDYGQVLAVEPRVTKESEAIKERKRQKRKEWKNKKKEKKAGRKTAVHGEEETNDDDIDRRESELFRTDHVAFGETVHAPPSLETGKLQQKVKEDQKVKKKNFLFMNNLTTKTESSAEDVKNSKVRQKILEQEREKAVLAYRQLKLNQRDSSLR